jgi:hypothetical protein
MAQVARSSMSLTIERSIIKKKTETEVVVCSMIVVNAIISISWIRSAKFIEDRRTGYHLTKDSGARIDRILISKRPVMSTFFFQALEILIVDTLKLGDQI